MPEQQETVTYQPEVVPEHEIASRKVVRTKKPGVEGGIIVHVLEGGKKYYQDGILIELWQLEQSYRAGIRYPFEEVNEIAARLVKEQDAKNDRKARLTEARSGLVQADTDDLAEAHAKIAEDTAAAEEEAAAKKAASAPKGKGKK